jgi:hypothetical protein
METNHAQLINKFSFFMQRITLLQCSREPTTQRYLVPTESSPHPYIVQHFRKLNDISDAIHG